ncbi:hypothetical protein [Methylobacterium sp. Leaf456]|uniref:hypothetical protein n=1 Tax=Methylobacterium sp. Leaf456 TaxID=1736382 RepID=UPI00336A44DF
MGDLKVDFMPDDAAILGFTNRWYKRGIETAVAYLLTEALAIRLLTPELFLATKFEAYLGRGEGDLLASHDLEDILLVVDGREEIVAEMLRSDIDIRQFIAKQLAKLFADRDFDHFVEGNIRGPGGRADIVRARLVVLRDAGAGESG